MIETLLAAAARRRRAMYSARPHLRRVLARPVISVGNLSLGGTGKTPLVAHVARLLAAGGHTPAILSRGYARPHRVEGAVVVSDGERVLAGYRTAGDEPLMLARQLPGCVVVVAEDRYLAGALAERILGCTVHVLDDGFQHARLARALDLVIVTRRDLQDRLVPFGRLREPPDAIRAADAVVVHATEEGMADAALAAGATTVFRMTRRLPAGSDQPALAFAGIGRPQEFFDMLAGAGWRLAARVPFGDHHRYSRRDMVRLAEEAARAGARVLVTTEKDAARLEGLDGSALPLVVVPLAVRVDPASKFEALLGSACVQPAGGFPASVAG